MKAAGSDFTKVTKVNIFIKTFEDFAAMNEVYVDFFPGLKPVRDSILYSILTPQSHYAKGTNLRCGVGPSIWCRCGNGMHCSGLIISGSVKFATVLN